MGKTTRKSPSLTRVSRNTYVQKDVVRDFTRLVSSGYETVKRSSTERQEEWKASLDAYKAAYAAWKKHPTRVEQPTYPWAPTKWKRVPYSGESFDAYKARKQQDAIDTYNTLSRDGVRDWGCILEIGIVEQSSKRQKNRRDLRRLVKNPDLWLDDDRIYLGDKHPDFIDYYY